MSAVAVRRQLGSITFLLACLACGACQEPEMEDFAPKRLPLIPQTATWVGWSDGGSWIECSYEPNLDTNWCTVWSDQSGEVMTRTYFVLRDTGQGVPEKELQYNFFSGHHIELADGRILEPKRYHGQERDPWEPPPIDPPRTGRLPASQ